MDPRAGRRVRGRPRKFLAEVRGELIAFAERAFRLAARRADGSTEREHLEAAAAHSEDARRALQLPELPAIAATVWAWFDELAARRRSNGFGPEKLQLADLDAWERRAGLRLREWEVEWIFALDGLYLAALAPRPAAPKGGEPKHRPRGKR